MKPRLAVLCYHRILDENDADRAWPYFERGTAVRSSTFCAQIAAISSFADIISEATAQDVLAGRQRLDRPAVWLTFDDAYRDVLSVVPQATTGTVFVTTCTPTRLLPADAWYAVLLNAVRNVGVIDLGLGPFEYDLRHREGRARLVNGPERRIYLRASTVIQASMLASLSTLLNATGQAPRLYLDDAELRSLCSKGWSLGSHGVSHAPFDTLNTAHIDKEARACRCGYAAARPIDPLPWGSTWW